MTPEQRIAILEKKIGISSTAKRPVRKNLKESSSVEVTREEFMAFFRDDEKLSELTTDDRLEIFTQILPGGSFLTKKLLQNLFDEYGVENPWE